MCCVGHGGRDYHRESVDLKVRFLSVASIVGAALFGTFVLASPLRALPAVIQEDIERQIVGEEAGPSKCASPLPLKAISQEDTAWAINYPIHCETDFEGQSKETSYWNWGGTAGPNFGVYYKDSFGGWIEVYQDRAHKVVFTKDGFGVLRHHVGCSNGPDTGCETQYNWDGNQLTLVETDYLKGGGRNE